MIRNAFLATVMLAATCGLASAEGFPGWDIYAGYSLLKADMDNPNIRRTYESSLYSNYLQFFGNEAFDYVHGFDISVTYNLNSWMGIEGGFSRHSGKFDLEDFYRRSQYDIDIGESDEESRDWKGDMDYERYTVLFGPQFSFRKKSRVRPFAHVLFGFSRLSGNKLNVELIENYTETYIGEDQVPHVYAETHTSNLSGKIKGNTGFAMALGGGVDIKASKNIGIRLVQLDYLPACNTIDSEIVMSRYGRERSESLRFGGTRFNNMKLSFGMTFNIGK